MTKINNKQFTLETALSHIYKNLLFTIAIFIAAYWIMPNQQFFDNRYKLSKTVSSGSFNTRFPAKLVNFKSMSALIESGLINQHLTDSIGDLGDLSFKVETNEITNVSLIFTAKDKDVILRSAEEAMKKFQEFDEKEITRALNKARRAVDFSNKMLEVHTNNEAKFSITDTDMDEYVFLLKAFDKAYPDKASSSSRDSKISGIIQVKDTEINRLILIEEKKVQAEDFIAELEVMIAQDFYPIKYLSPLSKNEISKYFPNTYFYFGLSFLLALLYNVILLNYKFRKSRN